MLLGIIVASLIKPSLQLVDPNTFQCNKWSPVTPAQWSTGSPSVALTHIFCGQINDNGEAEGFHSRPNNKNPTCAKAIGLYKEKNGLHCYEQEAVYDAKNIKWVNRPNREYCYFPSGWSIAQTVTNIQRIVNHCKNHITNNRICGQNYMGQNFDVIVYIRNQKEVVSAFATPPKKVKCNNICNLANMQVPQYILQLLKILMQEREIAEQ